MNYQYCPVCNHQLTGYVDYNMKVQTLLSQRQQGTQTLIRKLFKTYQKHNRDEVTLFNSYMFLQNLINVSDVKIVFVTKQFIAGP